MRPYQGKDELINAIRNAWENMKKETLFRLATTMTDRLVKVIEKKCIYRVPTLYFYLLLLYLIFISMTNCHQFPKLSFIVIFYIIYVHNLSFCIVISMLKMSDIKVLEFI